MSVSFNILDHHFDIIGISKMRLHDVNTIMNVEIDGYNYKPSKSQCRGTGIYVKKCHEFEIKCELSY